MCENRLEKAIQMQSDLGKVNCKKIVSVAIVGFVATAVLGCRPSQGLGGVQSVEKMQNASAKGSGVCGPQSLQANVTLQSVPAATALDSAMKALPPGLAAAFATQASTGAAKVPLMSATLLSQDELLSKCEAAFSNDGVSAGEQKAFGSGKFSACWVVENPTDNPIIKIYILNTAQAVFTNLTPQAMDALNTILAPYFQQQASTDDVKNMANGLMTLPNIVGAKAQQDVGSAQASRLSNFFSGSTEKMQSYLYFEAVDAYYCSKESHQKLVDAKMLATEAEITKSVVPLLGQPWYFSAK